MALEDTNNLQKYYEYLKGAKADVPPTFDSFQKTLSNEDDAKKYYGYLKANKFDAPDTYESFSNTLGLKKKRLYWFYCKRRKSFGSIGCQIKRLFGATTATFSRQKANRTKG